MSPAMRRCLLQAFQRLYGPDAPATRAKFGRYVASVGGQCSPVSSGYEAWVANYRERGHSGFRNRAWRKHMERSITPQAHVHVSDPEDMDYCLECNREIL